MCIRDRLTGVASTENIRTNTNATFLQNINVSGTSTVAGTSTANLFSGSGASLTSLPAAQLSGTAAAINGSNITNLTAGNLTGTLPAIDGSALTGIAATANVRTGILDVAGIATFRSDVNMSNINGGQIGGRRNLIINGAMMVAQRGTSSTTVGYQTLDRYYLDFTGLDESPTQAQVDVASGTTPYTNGFRKAYKITNGNQTSGAGSSDGIFLNYSIEAQDVANSGWNYTSSSSFVTLSFWVKSSVAQNFYGRLYSYDGTAQGYAFETGSLTADTWTKVTNTIPGNSNLTFDNNNAAGLLLELVAFRGTGFTASMTLNQWAAYNSNSRVPDMTSTWYTTNDATLEFTGIQLEVGSQATPFEHRSYGEELSLCQRYYFNTGGYAYGGSSWHPNGAALEDAYGSARFPTTMRANPTIVLKDANGNTDGRVTQWGAAHDIAATASYISETGFQKIMKSSGTFNNTTNWVISAGYTADAEL